MKRSGRVFVAIGALGCAASGLAAEPPAEVLHWTFEEVKAFETQLSQDPARSSQNPVLSIQPLGPGQSVRRTSFGKSGEAEIHGKTTDVFCILSGEAEFVVGGEIVSPRTTNPGEIRGPSIQGGARKKLGVGDMLIVPPGTPHQILLKGGQRVTFAVAKFAQ